MSALLLTAAAASFVAPSFSPDQVRQLEQSVAGNADSAVMIDAQVDPRGRISNCRASGTGGDSGLASSVCTRAEQIRIAPASVQGQAAFGVVRQRLRLPGQVAALRDPADIEVQVNALPAGQSSLRVSTNVVVNASGRPQACNAPGAPSGYGDVACSQVSAVTFGAIKDKDGDAVQYVRTVTVDFVTSAG